MSKNYHRSHYSTSIFCIFYHEYTPHSRFMQKSTATRLDPDFFFPENSWIPKILDRFYETKQFSNAYFTILRLLKNIELFCICMN